MMRDVFEFADELGPAKVIHVYEPSVALKAVLVVDRVAKGPSIGGLRMASDVTTEECFRLARCASRKPIGVARRDSGCVGTVSTTGLWLVRRTWWVQMGAVGVRKGP